MNIKHVFFTIVIASVVLLWACAPKQLLPPLPEPEAPPELETIDDENVFREAEVSYTVQWFADALLKYDDYIQRQPDGVHADRALKRMGDIFFLMGDGESARNAYKALLEKFPQSPQTPDAMLAILETYAREGAYEEVILYSFEIPDKHLTPEQRLRKETLTGDAYLAMGSPMDAFYFYSLVYEQSPPLAKYQTLQNLKGVLPHLNTVNTIYLLDRLKDKVLRGYLLYHLALLNLETARTDDAIAALSELVNRHPEHEQAEQAKMLILEIFSEAISSPHSIGCLLPLTGPYKTYGDKALQGIELALNEYHRVNKEKPIHIIVKDTASDPFQAVQAVRELDEANVSAIIGPIISAEPAAMEAQSRGIPIVLFTQKDNITRIGDFVFRNFITPRMQIESLAAYAVKEMGFKRFAILYPDENYGITYMNLFWDEVLHLGGAVVGAESYDPMDTDFAKPIKKLVGLYYEVPKELEIDFEFIPEDEESPDPMARTSPHMFAFLPREIAAMPELFFWGLSQPLGPLADDTDQGRKRDDIFEPIVDFEALFIPDAAKKAGLISPQLAYIDIEDVVLMGTNLWHSRQLISMSQDYIQGAVLTDGFFSESGGPRVRDFLKNFQTTFDEKPVFIQAVAYDSAKILLQTLTNPRIRFKSHLKDELLNLVDFPGVTGSTSFDYKGDAIRSPYILRIKGRSFQALKTP
ncbi:MAG: penicillin-binding protein activator [Deltaproteobacteria bacterium]|jgi:ABC-type branched-subunit amino acid transport system substrate-binding protein|nr:penicillin-binding protein activator [Deltaproteobacteria bacterium]